MNYTNDAFSLPTHSPTLPPHAPYNSSTQSQDNLDAEPGTTTSYTYPPTANDDSYNLMPHSAEESSSRGNQRTSLLPLHHSSLPPLQLYPPLSNTWNRIRSWLSEEYSELGDTLNWGVAQETLREVEGILGVPLPASVRESYLVTDGQEPESLNGFAEGLFFGLSFLPLEDALEEWKFWRDVDDDPSTGQNHRLKDSMFSVPTGYIRQEYSQKGWFPLVTDKAGNYLGVDLNPDELGTVGQVIVFGRDFDMKVVMWKGEGEGGWGRWLANFAEVLEAGEGFELGSGDSSGGSDDGLGYDGYFFDGSGRNRGEGGTASGSAGLRLTGDYRGWPVLEAWADRSYRLWRDAGLIKEPALGQQSNETVTPTTPQQVPALGHEPLITVSEHHDDANSAMSENSKLISHNEGASSLSLGQQSNGAITPRIPQKEPVELQEPLVAVSQHHEGMQSRLPEQSQLADHSEHSSSPALDQQTIDDASYATAHQPEPGLPHEPLVTAPQPPENLHSETEEQSSVASHDEVTPLSSGESVTTSTSPPNIVVPREVAETSQVPQPISLPSPVETQLPSEGAVEYHPETELSPLDILAVAAGVGPNGTMSVQDVGSLRAKKTGAGRKSTNAIKDSGPAPVGEPASSSTSQGDHAPPVPLPNGDMEMVDDASPESTIRLVGGGGSSGPIPVPVPEQEIAEHDSDDTASVKSDLRSPISTKKKGGIASGLKKFGSFGGVSTKRKKDDS